MKTYYSIVSVATKPQLDEKFNIGLLCVTPENTFFHFSETKFNIVSKLLSSNGRKLALSALKGMYEQINVSKELPAMFASQKAEMPYAVAEPYLGYLNRYNNNLVQFSKAVNIDLAIDYTVFKALFQKYIYSDEVFETIVQPKKQSFARIRNQFRKEASQYANTNFDVTNYVIHGLDVPVNVDVFGKNGAFVTGQSLDFSKNIAHLRTEISSFLYLTEHTLKANQESKSFVLGDEPSKAEKQNHQLWQNVRAAKIIEFVPTNESSRIIEYMKEKGVAPVQ